MLADRRQRADALALADLLEHWAAAVPMWDPEDGEPWYVFADRRYSLEKSLERRLRALPTCSLWMDDSTGTHVELSLAGIRVRSEACIASACRAWAAEIRRQLASHPDHDHSGVKQAVRSDGSDRNRTTQVNCHES
jgi:hypothetical protein